ncbi:uncharacterized protein ColSpa_00409 [Colletotrichum spaethianum]|uniref:Uncharacterized protein n=1 Tax=Colletotrichum spaethianum TaxID=700344 RepID=A0AA37L1H3_9PEZI|nr:uncharacterized protein ColSpa_00409 [Colletotrichum spaethianum]GKT40228.1 hypothetical protein ColSpa_00409 [Colletotrichum spaethianum]
MANISASGGILSFTPKSGAYYYETFPCQSLQSDSYTHVQLDIKAPVSGAAFAAQLNWASTCSATANTKTSFQVTGLTGGWQTLRIPLSSFAGANLDAALSLVIGSFSSTQQWQLDKVLFVCAQKPTTFASECESAVAFSVLTCLILTMFPSHNAYPGHFYPGAINDPVHIPVMLAAPGG